MYITFILKCLFSQEIFIELKEDVKSYDLHFKIGKHNNELLYLNGENNNTLLLNNCKKNNKDLICTISKEGIEEILTKNYEQFYINSFDDMIGIIQFKFLSNITISNNISKK